MELKSKDSVETELYLVSYRVPHAMQETEQSRRQLLEVNREFGVNWIRSYESNDGKRVVSIYEASGEVVLRDQAACLGLEIADLFPVAEVLPPTRRRH